MYCTVLYSAVLYCTNVPRRSILSVPEASSVWNGTFRCLAENVAGNQVQ